MSSKKKSVPKKAVEKKPEPAKAVAKKPEPKKVAKEPEVKEKKAPEIPPENSVVEKPEFKELENPCGLIAKAVEAGTPIEKVFVKAYDPAADACAECMKDKKYTETAKACKFNTELAKGLKATTKKSSGKKGGKPRGEVTPLGGSVTAGTGKMEVLMLRKEGATKEELAACRGAWTSHIASLKKSHPDYEFTHKDGKYYARKKKEA